MEFYASVNFNSFIITFLHCFSVENSRKHIFTQISLKKWLYIDWYIFFSLGPAKTVFDCCKCVREFVLNPSSPCFPFGTLTPVRHHVDVSVSPLSCLVTTHVSAKGASLSSRQDSCHLVSIPHLSPQRQAEGRRSPVPLQGLPRCSTLLPHLVSGICGWPAGDPALGRISRYNSCSFVGNLKI